MRQCRSGSVFSHESPTVHLQPASFFFLFFPPAVRRVPAGRLLTEQSAATSTDGLESEISDLIPPNCSVKISELLEISVCAGLRSDFQDVLRCERDIGRLYLQTVTDLATFKPHTGYLLTI